MQPQNQPQADLILPLPFPSPLPLRPTSFMVSSPSSAQNQQFDPDPRKKKRSKTMAVTTVDDPDKPRPKKPDPNAPKITRPCTECGKRFWSWKALFGHMRCHPERQWRGINPPPNLRSPTVQLAPVAAGSMETEAFCRVQAVMTEEDHEVAECLLKLADSPIPSASQGGVGIVVFRQTTGSREDGCMGPTMCQQFECSSCKKLFGSHQELGGHRASHKNVKGCFTMTRSGDGSEEPFLFTEVSLECATTTTAVIGNSRGRHACGVCTRVFPSGQALGGHRRCHWEKGEEEEEEEGGGGQFFCLDLNQPAPAAPFTANEDSSSSQVSDLTLDLRLGL